MSYFLGKTSLKRLEGVHPDLVKVVKRAIELTTQDFTVHEGLRTLERQRILKKQGASQTLNSKHLEQRDGFGHAVDLLPWGDFDGNGTSEITWEWAHFYPIAAAMQQAAKELNIKVRWGGAWTVLNHTDAIPADLVAGYVADKRKAGKKAFIDGPHFELVL
ncbi:M15 family metallopeptidase [Wielerella bovis]|uniref:M15 family metallopeptidase n=1 Tax=Wielerella bovis TaxID=2917790 RepID=UPI002019388D|nr:M15 family metallopeptidase [Wielerella bovis]ULJ64165.1 M15 family metallopeptidase [Wielerella bovis]